jgi:glutaminyl-tRNA synthetase
VLPTAKVEPSLAGAAVGTHFQFERTGYFCVDRDSKDGKLVFNRSVSLKDAWAKEQQKQK